MKSWYGTTEELWFANWDLGSPWEKPLPKAYTDFNPINFVDQWNKPIMVIQGGLDFRVGYEQGQEAFQAAKMKGLKTKFLYFLAKRIFRLVERNFVEIRNKFLFYQ